MLPCGAVCCRMLQRAGGVLQCVAVCCNELQCMAVCCSVLQSVAVCCNVLCMRLGVVAVEGGTFQEMA